MTMNDANNSSDPWDSLAEDLGVSSHSPSHSHSAPMHEESDAFVEHENPSSIEDGPELLDAPELLEEPSDIESNSEASAEDPSGLDAPRKKRRRRRRGKKRADGETETGEGGEVAEADQAGSENADMAGTGDLEDEEEDEVARPQRTAAIEEEMDADPSHEQKAWSVTSWKDLVAGLYRPER